MHELRSAWNPFATIFAVGIFALTCSLAAGFVQWFTPRAKAKRRAKAHVARTQLPFDRRIAP